MMLRGSHASVGKNTQRASIDEPLSGIPAKDLQRIMGFGSYKTAWS